MRIGKAVHAKTDHQRPQHHRQGHPARNAGRMRPHLPHIRRQLAGRDDALRPLLQKAQELLAPFGAALRGRIANGMQRVMRDAGATRRVGQRVVGGSSLDGIGQKDVAGGGGFHADGWYLLTRRAPSPQQTHNAPL
ncbi:hypothetical protein SDC9_105783 [bioreactor metagenome]|uniref:Uncharacterized protein n=1 Tax=bioreactor metagenome TaxID=1076179 RepID=A0A645B1L7_9ZZZZ